MIASAPVNSAGRRACQFGLAGMQRDQGNQRVGQPFVHDAGLVLEVLHVRHQRRHRTTGAAEPGDRRHHLLGLRGGTLHPAELRRVLDEVAKKGVPVIHLLRILTLARDFGLPLSPDFLPLPGEGEIFVKTMYRFPLALSVLVVYCGLCVLILAPEVRNGLFDMLPRRRQSTVVERKSS